MFYELSDFESELYPISDDISLRFAARGSWEEEGFTNRQVGPYRVMIDAPTSSDMVSVTSLVFEGESETKFDLSSTEFEALEWGGIVTDLMPVLEETQVISGVFRLRGGETIPFSVSVLWRRTRRVSLRALESDDERVIFAWP